MNYSEKVQEHEAKIQAAYDEAKKALDGLRLQAALYDAAQKLIDVQRPGETAVEILISTDSAKPLSELYAKAEADCNRAKDVLSKAEVLLADAQKPKATKTVYQIMFASQLTTNDGSYKIRESAESTFDTIEAALTALNRKGLSVLNAKYFFYFIQGKEVAA